jgi:uncharacterized protein YyaL (SSP411 family)
MVSLNDGEAQELHRAEKTVEALKEKADRKKRQAASLLEAAQEFVDRTPIYFVAALDRYVIRQDGEWTFLTDGDAKVLWRLVRRHELRQGVLVCDEGVGSQFPRRDA